MRFIGKRELGSVTLQKGDYLHGYGLADSVRHLDGRGNVIIIFIGDYGNLVTRTLGVWNVDLQSFSC